MASLAWASRVIAHRAIVLRTQRPEVPRPFRMWLYPVPAMLAFCGFLYLLVMRPKSWESIRVAVALIVVGTILFAIRRTMGRKLAPVV